MLHYVLTRAAYPASYPLEANRRRLALTERVTARSLASQTERRWRWVVVIDPADPLLDERRAVLSMAGVPVIEVPIHQKREQGAVIQDGRLVADVEPPRRRVGAVWADAVGRDAGDATRVATTRLDDDDALATDALARVRVGIEGAPPGLMAWIMPSGYRWHAGLIQPMTHLTNMFVTLDSPGEPLHVVMEAKHNAIRAFARVRYLDRAPGWLWVRHADTRSGSRLARYPLVSAISRRFDIDWAFLRGVA